MEEEVKTENVPQLRKAGRPRDRSQSDYKALAQQQAETIKALQAQTERLISIVSSGNVAADNPLTVFMPPKPLPPKRPEGFRYTLKRIKESENDDNDDHRRDVPARADNPNEPDPRFCVFCLQNVPALYGYKVSDAITPEEEITIKQCFMLHQQDAIAKSSLKGAKNKKHRDYAADHLELTATRLGRVPDAVAYFMGREWSSAEWYERELKEWEAKCRRFGQGLAQGA